jgi:predicted alpha/beta hydrolase family esterase
MNSYKTLLLPGWMSRVKNYGIGEGLDIWKKFGDPTANLDAQYLIGHSLGCHYALLNWQANRNARLILVNPPLLKRSSIVWLYRWLRYKMIEGLGVSFKDILAADIPAGIMNCHKLFQGDFEKIIREIPKKDLVIVKGQNDNYFCDHDVADFARAEQIRLIEVAGSGHNWSEDIRQTIINFIGDGKY